MSLTRIDLADFGSLDKIAGEIIRLYPGIPIPVPVEEIALALDIVEIREFETDDFEGALLTTAEKPNGIILVRANSMPQRRRFSVGHELAHFLSPWHRPLSESGFMCSGDDMRRNWAGKQDRAAEMEVEANRFSARLLMPRVRFVADMRRRQGCELDHVLDLARRYDVSKEATTRRYVEMQDEPCAAIVSHNGKVLRYYKNEDFPFLEVRPGHPVPRDSIAADNTLPIGVITDWEEVDGSIWLPYERGRRTRMVHEQVLPQQAGYRLTLLTLADED